MFNEESITFGSRLESNRNTFSRDFNFEKALNITFVLTMLVFIVSLSLFLHI